MPEQDSSPENPGRHLVSPTPIEVTASLNEKSASDERVTLTALMLKAVALTLADEPSFNAHWTEAGHELIDDINVGVAMDIPAGFDCPRDRRLP